MLEAAGSRSGARHDAAKACTRFAENAGRQRGEWEGPGCSGDAAAGEDGVPDPASILRKAEAPAGEEPDDIARGGSRLIFGSGDPVTIADLVP